MKTLQIKKSIIDGFESVKTNPKLLLVTLVYLGIIFAFVSAVVPFQDPYSFKNPAMLESFPSLFGVIIIVNLISIFLTGLLVILVAKGRKFPLMAGIKLVSSKYIKLVLATIFSVIIIGLVVGVVAIGVIAFSILTGISYAFFLLIVVAIFIALKFIFFYQVILLENKGIVQSLKTSWQITKGNMWRILGLAILTYIILFAIYLPAIVSQLVFANMLAASILNLIGTLFLTPWFIAILTHSYLQLRKR